MLKSSPKTSEKLTRKQIIDQRLTDAGWRIVPEAKFDTSKPLANYNHCAIEEYQTDNGPADYALCADGKILCRSRTRLAQFPFHHDNCRSHSKMKSVRRPSHAEGEPQGNKAM